jgi:hypothetical protein
MLHLAKFIFTSLGSQWAHTGNCLGEFDQEIEVLYGRMVA